MMRVVDLIKKKRDGGEHTDAEIQYLVSNFATGEIPDYQVSAWLMAMFLRGASNRRANQSDGAFG